MYEEADVGHVCVYVGKYIYMANVFLGGDADNSTLATQCMSDILVNWLGNGLLVK